MNLMEKYLSMAKKETIKSPKERSPELLTKLNIPNGSEDSPVQPLRHAVKTYSTILEGFLWVVQDTDNWPHMKGTDAPVYEAEEIRLLQSKGLTNEELKAAHEIKKTFNGTITNS